MKILGIESSCDETSVAVINNNTVLSNIVSSQLLHQEYGGVVPEFASREHMKNINKIMSKALEEANTSIQEIKAIAATKGPGLMGALLVGLSFAKGLSLSFQKPLIGVNHIEGHIMANFLDYEDLSYPLLCLLISGGHTMIIKVEGFGNYEVLGQSVDDAAGEAFDKGGKILHLKYPAGPIIDKFAKKGNKKFHQFPRSSVKNSKFDYSFSGLKTSLYYLVQNKGREWTDEHLEDLCASYQEAIIDTLKNNFFKAVDQEGIENLVIAGGVAANSRLREVFRTRSEEKKCNIFFPSLDYCTDNAAMIARAGLEDYRREKFSSLDIDVDPNLKL